MSTLNKMDFPESVRCLVNKNKTELLNIIARKDQVETDLKHQIAAKNSDIDLNKATIAEYIKNIEEKNNVINSLKIDITDLNTVVNSKNNIINDLDVKCNNLQSRYEQECDKNSTLEKNVKDLTFDIVELENKNMILEEKLSSAKIKATTFGIMFAITLAALLFMIF